MFLFEKNSKLVNRKLNKIFELFSSEEVSQLEMSNHFKLNFLSG